MTDVSTQPATDLLPVVLDAMRRVEPFAGLAEPMLRELAAGATLRVVRRGERIWEKDGSVTSLAIVVSGRVRCWIPGQDDRLWVSAIVRAGGFCGLAACIDAGPPTCRAEPMERSRVILIEGAALRSAFDRDPEFARGVARAMAREVRRLIGSCEDVTLRTPLQRLAHYLSTQPAAAGRVEMRETQTQIAAQLGTVREVVGRGFRLLEARGVLSRDGRVVRVLRPKDLTEIAATGR